MVARHFHTSHCARDDLRHGEALPGIAEPNDHRRSTARQRRWVGLIAGMIPCIPINPEGRNDRGPNPDAPRKGLGDRAVLIENDLVRQFGEKLGADCVGGGVLSGVHALSDSCLPKIRTRPHTPVAVEHVD